jgi:hypothetical protein
VEIRCQTRGGTFLRAAAGGLRAIFVGSARTRAAARRAGEEAPNVLTGAGSCRINSGQPVGVGGQVLVIGGGDSAVDAAQVARRLGAETASSTRTIRGCRRSPTRWRRPSTGIQIDFLVAGESCSTLGAGRRRNACAWNSGAGFLGRRRRCRCRLEFAIEPGDHRRSARADASLDFARGRVDQGRCHGPGGAGGRACAGGVSSTSGAGDLIAHGAGGSDHRHSSAAWSGRETAGTSCPW